MVNLKMTDSVGGTVRQRQGGARISVYGPREAFNVDPLKDVRYRIRPMRLPQQSGRSHAPVPTDAGMVAGTAVKR